MDVFIIVWGLQEVLSRRRSFARILRLLGGARMINVLVAVRDRAEQYVYRMLVCFPHAAHCVLQLNQAFLHIRLCEVSIAERYISHQLRHFREPITNIFERAWRRRLIMALVVALQLLQLLHTGLNTTKGTPQERTLS